MSNEDDWDDEFEEMDGMSMEEFLEFLYENRHYFFGPPDEDEELEFQELEKRLDDFINTPIPTSFTTINGIKAPVSFQCGKWELYTN